MTGKTYWVLRETSTGRLLPTHRSAMTRVEFGDNGPPRLFTTKGAAANALACWRMGYWRLTGDEDGYYPEPSLLKGNEAIAARRKTTEVDIVEIGIVEADDIPAPHIQKLERRV